MNALTQQERRVAEGVFWGRSNREIAITLAVSEKTVEKHLNHIFRKLGFTSRSQVAVYISHGGGRADPVAAAL